MKRKALVQHLRANGCALTREGSNIHVRTFALKHLFLALCFVLETGCSPTQTGKSGSGSREVGRINFSPVEKSKFGICRVVFDRSGRAASAVMVKSSGSVVLDRATVDFAMKNWTGKPNTASNVPITYSRPR